MDSARDERTETNLPTYEGYDSLSSAGNSPVIREPEKSIKVSLLAREKGEHLRLLRPLWRTLYTVSDHVSAYFESFVGSLPFHSEEERQHVIETMILERSAMPQFSIFSPSEAPFVINRLHQRYVHYLLRSGFVQDKSYPIEFEATFKELEIAPHSLLVVAALPQPVTDFRERSLSGEDFIRWLSFSQDIASFEMEVLIKAGRDERVKFYRLNEPKVHIAGKRPFYYVLEAKKTKVA